MACCKDARFIKVFDRVIAPCHVAIDGGITYRDLGFIACGQQHFAKFIRQRHQKNPAQTGLDVFLGQIWIAACKERGKRGLNGLFRGLNRQTVKHDPKHLGHIAGIIKRSLRGIARRQHHAMHVFRANGIGGNGRNQGRIHPARQTQNRARKPCLGHVITQTQNHRVVIRLDVIGQARQISLVNLPALSPLSKFQMGHTFFKGGHLRHQGPALVQGETCAIKNLIILSTDKVQIDQWQARLDHARDHMGLPQSHLAAMIGRAIGDKQNL